MFISHAKADGRSLAQSLQEHVSSTAGVDVFFDEVDLEPSSGFESQFIKRIGNATMVLLMTDTWASRYWCQWEALQGKEQKRPIVLVDLLTEGERRHFPYLGNFATVRVGYPAGQP